MAVCARYGIRHAIFKSWPVDDQDLAVLWEIEQSETCPECRTRPRDWDPAQGGHEQAFLADPHQCRGCEVKRAAEKQLGDDPDLGWKMGWLRNPDAGPPP